MAPVKIKDIVSFTSQDQKNCVENLCATGQCARPWLCSPRDRSGVLKAELQMERATAISYVDVGNCGSAFIQIDVGRSSWPLERPYVTLLPTATLMSPADSKQEKGRTGVRMFKKDFLPAGVDELWDRVRVTCSQPFNRRTQFGLSFLRIRSLEEEGGATEEGRGQGSQGQRTPEQQTSRVREWLSSPAVQRTFFGRGTGEGSPGVDQTSGTPGGSGRDRAGLSRAARMVITAAQSGRRGLLPALPSSASPPSPASPSSVQRRTTAVCCDRTQDTCTEEKASTRNSTGVHHKKAGRQVKRKLDSRKRPQAHTAPCRKKPKTAPCEQSLGISLPCSTAPPGGSEAPETCCPLCGGYFSPEYLPQHASFCQGEEPDQGMSFTPPNSPAHTGGPAPRVEQDMVPCPLCSFRFPTSQIQLHASSCGDPLEPEWAWVD
ncbi:short transient receptor potential channel 2 isoform X2 [Anguilla rostrata]|uniref:short transient receptor potential channel 2 isoform X2 n=1 Tax=Anguilla rostrata TaxID=7938 RepID=UPI0030CC7A62